MRDTTPKSGDPAGSLRTVVLHLSDDENTVLRRALETYRRPPGDA